jgi:hypothetical protein
LAALSALSYHPHSESPPYFCAATQAGRDIIEYLIDQNFDLLPHPLESYIIPVEAMAKLSPSQQDTVYRFVAVYVDNFILAGIESSDATLLRRMARAALFGIHSVFPPVEVTGHIGGKDPQFPKNWKKLMPSWQLKKKCSGSWLTASNRRYALPAPKASTIVEEISRLLKWKSLPLKRMEKIVSKLVHTCTILPTSTALLTPLYHSMATCPSMVGLGKESEVRAALLDLGTMIKSIAGGPTL